MNRYQSKQTSLHRECPIFSDGTAVFFLIDLVYRRTLQLEVSLMCSRGSKCGGSKHFLTARHGHFTCPKKHSDLACPDLEDRIQGSSLLQHQFPISLSKDGFVLSSHRFCSTLLFTGSTRLMSALAEAVNLSLPWAQFEHGRPRGATRDSSKNTLQARKTTRLHSSQS